MCLFLSFKVLGESDGLEEVWRQQTNMDTEIWPVKNHVPSTNQWVWDSKWICRQVCVEVFRGGQIGGWRDVKSFMVGKWRALVLTKPILEHEHTIMCKSIRWSFGPEKGVDFLHGSLTRKQRCWNISWGLCSCSMHNQNSQRLLEPPRKTMILMAHPRQWTRDRSARPWANQWCPLFSRNLHVCGTCWGTLTMWLRQK